MACYATMATPPEDDFPTTRTCPTGSGACKCTDEAHTKLIAQIKAERERSGASTMTVEVSPEGAVAESGRSRPSIYNTRLASPEQLASRRMRRGLMDLLEPGQGRHLDNLEAVCRAMIHIGPRAQSLLVKIAERLAHGARQYGGDFDDKPRDWNKEALEEHMDAVVYMAMACMERDEAKAADKARAEAANRGPSTAMPPVDMRHYNIDPRDGAAPASHGCSPACDICHTPPAWPLTTPGEAWEKTRDGCG